MSCGCFYALIARLLAKLATCLTEVSVIIVRARHVSKKCNWAQEDIASLVNLLHMNFHNNADLAIRIQVLQPDWIFKYLKFKLLEETEFQANNVGSCRSIFMCPSKLVQRKSSSEQLFCCELTEGCPLSWQDCDRFSFECIWDSSVQECDAP